MSRNDAVLFTVRLQARLLLARNIPCLWRSFLGSMGLVVTFTCLLATTAYSSPVWASPQSSIDATEVAVEIQQNGTPFESDAQPTSLPQDAQESAVSQGISFTPSGQGTVVNYSVSSDGMEFYTIVTENKNVFHLIIDRQRGSQNVYFLNAVTEDDLLGFVTKPPQKEASTREEAVPTPPAPTDTPEKEPPTPSAKQKSLIPALTGLILLLLTGAGGYYYFRVWKPKKEAQGGVPLDALFSDDEDELVVEE